MPDRVERPALGRATDKRVTAEYLATRNLKGAAFDPAHDVDLVDNLNNALGEVEALVAYADPELHGELVTLKTQSQQQLVTTAQTTEELRSVAATYSLGRAPAAGDPAGIYRWVDSGGAVVDTAWTGSAGTTTPALSPRDRTSLTALAVISDHANATADIQAWITRALAVQSGEMPAGTYVLTQRLVIDCQNKRLDLNMLGRLKFDVRDANGGPMVRLSNVAGGSNINLGEIEHINIPVPSRDITEGNETATDVPVDYGPAFTRLDTHPNDPAIRHWRTNSDHALEVDGAFDSSITVQVKASRAMGIVVRGGGNLHIYGTVKNTLADGTHMHDAPSSVHWHVNAENTGDDAFPVVPKVGEGVPYNIHYYGQATGGFGRHFLVAGGEYVHWHSCLSTDAYKEGFLITYDAAYTTGVPRYVYGTDIRSVNSGQRDTSQSGENQPAGIRVGQVAGGPEDNVYLTRAISIGSRGCGYWIGGKHVVMNDCQSSYGGLPDAIYSTDFVAHGAGSRYRAMAIHASYARIRDGVQFRKQGLDNAYGLLLTGPGQVGPLVVGNDFGTEYATPLATEGALPAGAVIQDNIGVTLGALPAVGTAGIANTPALPGSGAGFITNSTPFDVVVLIHGGSVTSINLQPPNCPIVDIGAQRSFLLPRGWAVNPYWSAGPERWHWVVSR